MAEPREPLTERELEIVRLLGTGAGNKEIAAQLFLSPNTVKVHLRNIFTKLEAQSRTEVTMIAVRNGWIALEQAASADGAVALPENHISTSETASPNTPAPDNSTPITITKEAAVAQPDQAVATPPIAPLVAAVPVAPNPQPLPKLAVWQRVALIAATLLVIFITAITTSTPRSSASDTLNPLRIGPMQPKSSFLLRGESSRWYLRQPLPVARARSAAASVGNDIYLIGGEVDQAVSGDVMMFEPVSNTWTVLDSPKPTPVANTSAATANGRIYIAGGTTADGAATGTLEVFDPRNQEWQSLTPLAQPVAGHAFAALGDQLFVFGGANAQGVTAASYRYDITQDKWQPIKALPTRRSLAAAATLNDRIYVVGGYDDGRELATCEYYTPTSDTWETCAPTTIPRSSLGLVRVGANLFAIGGGVSGFIGFNERYDAASNRWTAIETPLTSDWQSIAVATRGTEFYVFGGYSNGERLAFTYVYEVLTTRVFVPAFQSQGSDNRTP